jgi:hypothetical protein
VQGQGYARLVGGVARRLHACYRSAQVADVAMRFWRCSRLLEIGCGLEWCEIAVRVSVSVACRGQSNLRMWCGYVTRVKGIINRTAELTPNLIHTRH